MKIDDAKGRYHGPRDTYRAAGNVVTAADQLPFLVLQVPAGGGRKLRLQRIKISGITLTAVAYLRLQVAKATTAWTGGTAVAATVVKLDKDSPAPIGTVNHYTAGPTGGGAIDGNIAERRVLGQATTAAAAGIPGEVDFDFASTNSDEAPAIALAGDSIVVKWGANPASAPTLSYEVEWTEDSN